MICPGRCTMELWGAYQGIKVYRVYRCKWCTVTSYRSVEMDYHGKIMNIPAGRPSPLALAERAYKEGHRDARHAAAELAIEADNLIAEMAVENAELREQLAAKDAELERVRSLLSEAKSELVYADENRRRSEALYQTPPRVSRLINKLDTSLASPAGEAEQAVILPTGWRIEPTDDGFMVCGRLGESVFVWDSPERSYCDRVFARLAKDLAQPTPVTEPYKPGQLTLNSLKGLVARIEMDADPFTDLGIQCRASLPALKEMIARLESRPRPIPLDEVLAEFASDPETKAAMEQAKEGLKAAIARGEKVFEAKDIVFVAVQEKK